MTCITRDWLHRERWFPHVDCHLIHWLHQSAEQIKNKQYLTHFFSNFFFIWVLFCFMFQRWHWGQDLNPRFFYVWQMPTTRYHAVTEVVNKLLQSACSRRLKQNALSAVNIKMQLKCNFLRKIFTTKLTTSVIIQSIFTVIITIYGCFKDTEIL